jgi:hypothetical protein
MFSQKNGCKGVFRPASSDVYFLLLNHFFKIKAAKASAAAFCAACGSA